MRELKRWRNTEESPLTLRPGNISGASCSTINVIGGMERSRSGKKLGGKTGSCLPSVDAAQPSEPFSHCHYPRSGLSADLHGPDFRAPGRFSVSGCRPHLFLLRFPA